MAVAELSQADAVWQYRHIAWLGGRHMPANGSDVLRLIVGDGVPGPVPGPDGRPGPPVPIGNRVTLRGRGETFYREVEGPPGAPTVVLLHGWMASGGLTWFRAFDELARDFHVIAPDLRGHARGLRSRRHVRMADCADDVASLIASLGTGPVILAGYSMGGPVAQLMWRRHPECVRGLVLCATAARMRSGPSFGYPLTDAYLAGLAGVARTGEVLAQVPRAVTRAARDARPRRPAGFVEWVVQELRRHDSRMLVEAARSVGRYDARPWIDQVDVPTAVVVTARDRMVPVGAQREMAQAIPRASVYELPIGHSACLRSSFAEPVAQACLDVAGRLAS